MRFLLSLALTTGIIALFNWFGWFTLLANGHTAQGPKEIVSTALASALIFWAIALFITFITFGMIWILFPFVGGFVLMFMHDVAPGYIQLNEQNNALTYIGGGLILLVTLVTMNDNTEKKKSTTTN